MCDPAFVDALVVGRQSEVDIILIWERPEAERVTDEFCNFNRRCGAVPAKIIDQTLGRSEMRPGIAPG